MQFLATTVFTTWIFAALALAAPTERDIASRQSSTVRIQIDGPDELATQGVVTADNVVRPLPAGMDGTAAIDAFIVSDSGAPGATCQLFANTAGTTTVGGRFSTTTRANLGSRNVVAVSCRR